MCTCVCVCVHVCVRFRVSDTDVLLLTFSGVFVGATAAGLSATPAPPPTPTTPTLILTARRECRCHRERFTVRPTAPRRVAHRVAAEDTAMRRRATPRPVASSFTCGPHGAGRRAHPSGTGSEPRHACVREHARANVMRCYDAHDPAHDMCIVCIHTRASQYIFFDTKHHSFPHSAREISVHPPRTRLEQRGS